MPDDVQCTGVLIGSPLAVTDAHFGESEGPIFLDKLRCGDMDMTLLACPSGERHGVATCSHAQEVGVRCPGK